MATRSLGNITLINAKSYCSSGNFRNSFAHYVLYLKLNPDKVSEMLNEFVYVMKEFSEQLERESKIEELFRCYKVVNEIISDSEVILNNIGAQLFRIGYTDEAAMYIRKSLEINPEYTAARENLDNICCHLVERWHFRMLNDVNRNTAFLSALQKAAKLGFTSVLDMGAGTGILSIFAKEAKFRDVYACERSSTMCDLIERVVVANQCQDDITIIAKNSTELISGTDFPERVDLLVTETFDAALFGEHVIPSLIHAWENILHPETGKVIPERATVYVCAIESEKLRLQNRFVYPGIQNLNFNHINIVCNTSQFLEEPYSTENLHNLSGHLKFLSEPIPLTTVNFNDVQMLKRLDKGVNFDMEIPIKLSGRLDALAVWFDLHLIQDITLTTNPSTPNCWEQAIFPVIPHNSPSCNADEKGSIIQKQGDKIQAVFSLNQNSLHLQSWMKIETGKPRIPQENHGHCSNEEAEKVFYLDRDEVFLLNNLHWNRLQCRVLEQIKAHHPKKDLSLLDFSTSFSPISLQMGCHGYPNGTVIMKSEFHDLYQTLQRSNDLSQLSFDLLDTDTDTWQGLARKHDVILCNPVELCGALRQQIFEDLEILKLTCLETTGKIVPGIIRVNAMCIESESLMSDSAVLGDDVTLGFRIAEFINMYQSTLHVDVDLTSLDHVRLTDPFQLFTIDLNEKLDDGPSSFLDMKRSVNVVATDTGHVTAVIYWFEFVLCDGITISTLESVLPWRQAAVMMKSCDIDLVSGQQIKVTGTLKNSCLGISVDCDLSEGS